MKIFILDDSPLRLDIFRRHFEGDNIVWTAQTAKEAIAILESHQFDLMFLDHDLGGKPPEYYGQDCDVDHPNTGSEVIRWMQKHPQDYNVVVHSRNSMIVPGMISKLNLIDNTRAISIPFPELVANWNLGSAI